MFRNGEIIINTGDDANALFVVFEGDAEVCNSDGTFTRLPPKSHVGAEGLQGKVYESTVRAIAGDGCDAVTCLVLDKQSLDDLGEASLSERLREVQYSQLFICLYIYILYL